jgi:hypothetical protein
MEAELVVMPAEIAGHNFTFGKRDQDLFATCLGNEDHSAHEIELSEGSFSLAEAKREIGFESRFNLASESLLELSVFWTVVDHSRFRQVTTLELLSLFPGLTTDVLNVVLDSLEQKGLIALADGGYRLAS